MGCNSGSNFIPLLFNKNYYFTIWPLVNGVNDHGNLAPIFTKKIFRYKKKKLIPYKKF